MDQLYAFVMKGELAKVALEKEIYSKKNTTKTLFNQYLESLSVDLLDQEEVEVSRLMSTVYIAISAFENSVRNFVIKVIIEDKGDNWWMICVSEKIRRNAEIRRNEEEKIKWHSTRGESIINYVDFGDLISIISQNYALFEVHIISLDWARQIFMTLERSRNIIMHSGILSRSDIERIGTNIRDWIRQVG